MQISQQISHMSSICILACTKTPALPDERVIDTNPSGRQCQLSSNYDYVFDSSIGIVGTESIKAALSCICIVFKLIRIARTER